MTISKICIVGLYDYVVLTGDTSYGHIGGEAVQHVLLAKAWRDLGLDVSIVVYDHGQPKETVIDGIRVVSSYRQEGGMPGMRFLHPRLTQLIRAMRSVDAEVYYQSPAGPWTGVVAWYAKRFGKRSIVRLASDSDCLRGKQPGMRLRRDRWMFDYGVLNATLVSAQTEQQRRLLMQHYGRPSDVVNIAVETPKQTQSRKDIDVLWLGTLRTVKRPDIVLELARRLPQYRFALVGGSVPGAEAYFERIAREAKELPNVIMTGAVSYQETGDWFDRALLHVNTSDYEGFPNTFVQSWVRRVPVISFFDPDGVIQQRGLGRRCADIVGMQAALEELLRDAATRAEVGARAHAFAVNHFSARQVAARYLDLVDVDARVPVGAEA